MTLTKEYRLLEWKHGLLLVTGRPVNRYIHLSVVSSFSTHGAQIIYAKMHTFYSK